MTPREGVRIIGTTVLKNYKGYYGTAQKTPRKTVIVQTSTRKPRVKNIYVRDPDCSNSN